MTAEEESEKKKRLASASPEEREEYDATLLLERLESLLEEMEELGVQTRKDVERQIEALHLKLNQGLR